MTAILGQIVLAWLFADLMGGVLHWIEDMQLLPDFLDRHVGAPNRLHHVDPLAVTRDPNVLRRNSTTIAANIPVIAALYLVTGPSLFWFAASAGGLITYEVHRWAHAPRTAPRIVRVLQETGIFQSPKHHAGHHAPPQNRRYCILTDFLNPVLDELQVWRGLERLLGIRMATSPALSMGFDEDHRVERNSARVGSIKRSHRSEGRNWVD